MTKTAKKIWGLDRNVFFTGVTSFFMDVSSEMVYSLVPIFLSSVLHVDKAIIGLIEGIAESTASLLKMLSGWLSDRLGRRKPLMVFGYGISTPLGPCWRWLVAGDRCSGRVLWTASAKECARPLGTPSWPTP